MPTRLAPKRYTGRLARRVLVPATLRTPPAARVAVDSEVAVWTTGVGGYTHYGFQSVVRRSNGTLVAVCRGASSHLAWDGDLLAKKSTDGQTWTDMAGSASGAGTLILDGATTGWDERDVSCVKELASGRLVMAWGRRKLVSGITKGFPAPFSYSDDGGATWSAPVAIDFNGYEGTDGVHDGATYASDIVELGNGDLVAVGYGFTVAGDTATTISCSRSTNGGASWSYLSRVVTPSQVGGYSAVEPQAELLDDGTIFVSFHIESGSPQQAYTVLSDTSGVLWSRPRLAISSVGNRQGLTYFPSTPSTLISYNEYGATGSALYRESWDGANYGSAVTVKANPIGGAGMPGPLWIMATPLAGTGLSQNIGFMYSGENVLSDPTTASIFWRQFSGIDGTIVRLRPAFETWAWTDAATRAALTPARAAGETWGWTDGAGRSVTDSRTAINTWTWSDSATGGQAAGRTASETWAWAESATQSTAHGYTRTAAETWSWSDNTARAALTYTRGASEAWAWTDGVSRVVSSVNGDPSIVLHTMLAAGATLGAYLVREWKGQILSKWNPTPGMLQATATVDDWGLAPFYGLAPDEYVAWSPERPRERIFFAVT